MVLACYLASHMVHIYMVNYIVGTCETACPIVTAAY